MPEEMSEREIAARRDAALKRALTTPPRPHNVSAPKRKVEKVKSRGRAKPKSP